MPRTRMTMVAAFGVMWIGAELAAQTCGWRWVNPNPPRIDVRSAAVASGRIVAVGARGLALYSGDGRQWTLADTGVSADLMAVARGGGRFAAVGDDVIVTSPDGVAWIVMDGTGWSGTSRDLHSGYERSRHLHIHGCRVVPLRSGQRHGGDAILLLDFVEPLH